MRLDDNTACEKTAPAGIPAATIEQLTELKRMIGVANLSSDQEQELKRRIDALEGSGSLSQPVVQSNYRDTVYQDRYQDTAYDDHYADTPSYRDAAR